MAPHIPNPDTLAALRLSKAEKYVGKKEKKSDEKAAKAAIASDVAPPPPSKPKRRRFKTIWKRMEVLATRIKKKKEEWPGQRKARRAQDQWQKNRAGVPNAMDVDGSDGWNAAPGESEDEDELELILISRQVKEAEVEMKEGEDYEERPAGFFNEYFVGKMELSDSEDDGDDEECVLDDEEDDEDDMIVD